MEKNDKRVHHRFQVGIGVGAVLEKILDLYTDKPLTRQ
jgi:hypothetical protein